METFIGEIAALLAALGFSFTSISYTFAGRKINSVKSIALSLPISWLVLLVIHRITLGEFFPTTASLDRWFFLGASGILAFVVSSYFVLNAYQYIGPRLTMLILSFAPVLGALLAWIFLGQTLPANAAIGIAIVIFGIVWVVFERSKAKTDGSEPNVSLGIIHACLGTLAQATAFVFASKGIAGGFPPYSAALIRITVSIIAVWAVIAFQHNLKSTATSIANDGMLLFQLTVAAISGPVIAGSLLLFSFQHTSVGVSTALSHTTAIMLIPIGYFVFKERITTRAIIGTIVTIIGIAVLFI